MDFWEGRMLKKGKKLNFGKKVKKQRKMEIWEIKR